MLGFVQLSFAQTQFKDATQAYNYWAKRGIVEAVFAFMEDYENPSEDEYEGKIKFHKEFIENIEEKKDMPDLMEVSELLENNSWNKTRKNVFDPLNNKFKAQKDLSKDFFIFKAADGENYSGSNYDQATEKILEGYRKTLDQIKTDDLNKKPIEQVENKSSEFAVKGSNRRVVKEVSASNFTMNISLFLIGVLLGGWLIFSYSKQKIYALLRAEKREYREEYRKYGKIFTFPYIQLIYILKDRKDHYKNKVSEKINSSKTLELEEKIKVLEDENIKLRSQNYGLKKEIENQNPKKSQSQLIQPKQSVKLKTVYFNMPESNGGFNIKDGKPMRDPHKYFKIEHSQDSASGELSYLTSDWDKEAINGLDDYLKPVCEIEGASNLSASKVTMIIPGKVTLINDSWIIDPNNKIKIKLS